MEQYLQDYWEVGIVLLVVLLLSFKFRVHSRRHGYNEDVEETRLAALRLQQDENDKDDENEKETIDSAPYARKARILIITSVVLLVGLIILIGLV